MTTYLIFFLLIRNCKSEFSVYFYKKKFLSLDFISLNYFSGILTIKKCHELFVFKAVEMNYTTKI